MAKESPSQALKLLREAPDDQFPPMGKALLNGWNESTDSKTIHKVVEYVKRHRVGSHLATQLLVSLMHDALQREGRDYESLKKKSNVPV